MWLISNPLFEVGAGLVLFAATIWMLLNATARRPVAVQAPVVAAAELKPRSASTLTETVPSLGPLSVRAARGMFFAEEVEGVDAEPPLSLISAPSPTMRVSDIDLSPAGPTADDALNSPVAEERVPSPATPSFDPVPQLPEARVSTLIEEAQPAVEPEAVAVDLLEPPSVAPDAIDGPEGTEAAPLAGHTDAPGAFGDALAAASVMPADPISTMDPAPTPSFGARLEAWLKELLQDTPGAPPFATVASAAARMKRGIDPAWPQPARDLRATIECLGKLAPGVFATPLARDATEAFVATAGAPIALIWPQVGAAFDPHVHDARSGEGMGVAAVIRPGLTYGGVAAPPALVVRGSASSSNASG